MMVFKRGINPQAALNIGKIHEAKKWLENKGINYSNLEEHLRPDGMKIYEVDVDGDVYFENFHINDVPSIPDYIRFRNVTGRFIFEKLPTRQDMIHPEEGKADPKMKMDIGMINLTREWLKKYHIDHVYLERNTQKNGPVFYVDVDEDVVFWDMHINDIASMPDYFKFRHINGRAILCNGNRMCFTKHLLLKSTIAMAEKYLKKENKSNADIRVRNGGSNLILEVNGNVVLKEFDFKFNDIPMELRQTEGRFTILDRLTAEEILERLKEHGKDLIANIHNLSFEDRNTLQNLFDPDINEFMGIAAESNDQGLYSINRKTKNAASALIEICEEKKLPSVDQYGVELNDYSERLKA